MNKIVAALICALALLQPTLALAQGQSEPSSATGIIPGWAPNFLLGFGPGALLIAAFLSWFFANPNELQQHVTRAIAAIGCSAVAGFISGLLSVSIKSGTANQISAAGAFAVFVIVYFFRPGVLYWGALRDTAVPGPH